MSKLTLDSWPHIEVEDGLRSSEVDWLELNWHKDEREPNGLRGVAKAIVRVRREYFRAQCQIKDTPNDNLTEALGRALAKAGILPLSEMPK